MNIKIYGFDKGVYTQKSIKNLSEKMCEKLSNENDGLVRKFTDAKLSDILNYIDSEGGLDYIYKVFPESDKKYALNFASYTDNELHCECLGIFENEKDAIHAKKVEIAGDENNPDYIKSNTQTTYIFDNGCAATTYRIQEIKI